MEKENRPNNGYRSVPTRIEHDIPTKLRKLAKHIGENAGGVKVSQGDALAVAVNEAMASRGLA